MEQEHSDLPSGSVGESAGIDTGFVFSCPYLGMLEDSITSFAYPASANHCFRVESPTSVDLAHQEEYCLSGRHAGCHVFQMANAANADTRSVATLTEPEMRQRRVSLYAFPLILILILLAAIVWWPAPGTAIQESLVLGAQNDRETSNGATLNGKSGSQPAVAEKVVEITSPDAVGEPAATVSLNESGNQTEQEGADTSTNAPVEAQISGEETSSANSAQDISIETSETSPGSTSSSKESPSRSAGETVSSDASSDTDRETVIEEASPANDEDTDESPAVIIADLPVISSDILAVAAAPEESETTNAFGELVTLVGPAIHTSPSLDGSSEDVNVLPVYQDPASDSALLSLIERKQFVTLLGRDSSGAWLKVRLDNGVEGWIDAIQSEAGVVVSSLPLEGDATASEPSTEQLLPAVTSYPVIRSAFVGIGALNVRSGPGVAYEAITVINSGELVGLIGRGELGPWVRVRLNSGLEGWVNSSLLAQAN